MNIKKIIKIIDGINNDNAGFLLSFYYYDLLPVSPIVNNLIQSNINILNKNYIINR